MISTRKSFAAIIWYDWYTLAETMPDVLDAFSWMENRECPTKFTSVRSVSWKLSNNRSSLIQVMACRRTDDKPPISPFNDAYDASFGLDELNTFTCAFYHKIIIKSLHLVEHFLSLYAFRELEANLALSAKYLEKHTICLSMGTQLILQTTATKIFSN